MYIISVVDGETSLTIELNGMFLCTYVNVNHKCMGQTTHSIHMGQESGFRLTFVNFLHATWPCNYIGS